MATLQGDAAGDIFGWNVSGVDDVNGDGHPDIAISAPGGNRLTGYVRIYSGRWLSLRQGTQVLAQFTGTGAGDEFGLRTAAAGDVNCDGVRDLMVTAWQARTASGPGYITVLSGKKLALATDVHRVSLAARGRQAMRIDAGSAHGGRTYLVAGSASGIKPGIRVGTVTVPLNPDGYFGLSLALPNSPLLTSSLGRLDASGRPTASFNAIPSLPPSLAGVVLHHACVVLGQAPVEVASAAAPVTLSR